jgi:outer membrane protein assembly factor BamB
MKRTAALAFLLPFLLLSTGIRLVHPAGPPDEPVDAPDGILVTAPRYLNRVFDGGHDWLQFEQAASEGAAGQQQAVTAENVSELRVEWRMHLPGAVDGSPAYLSDAETDAGRTDLLFVNTTAGDLVAFEAHVGRIIWMFDPPAGPRWTTSSPAVDPNRQFVYTYGLDGYVHKIRIFDGSEVRGDGWPELVTLKGSVEKGSSALTIITAKNGRTYLYATTAAYPEPGDDGDYQGHVVAIDLATGAQNIFNAACSDRTMHFVENGNDSNDCANRQSGIWARSGVAYDAETDRIFVTNGNGVYDADRGGFNWGSSIVALRPDGSLDGGTPLDSYTPANHQELTDQDLDLSSTTVAVLPRGRFRRLPRLGVQGGKDWLLRLINLQDLSGQSGPRHLGGELQILKLAQGGEILTRPATWLNPATHVPWVFVANPLGLSAYSLSVDKSGRPELVQQWVKKAGGTSPIIANGVLYYTGTNAIRALDPATGNLLWQSRFVGAVHWSTPILVNGTLYIGDTAGNVTAFAIDARP